jgi:hypothetical protein
LNHRNGMAIGFIVITDMPVVSYNSIVYISQE